MYDALAGALAGNGAGLEEGDVIVVSTKLVSNAQGRLVDLRGVRPSGDGLRAARRFGIAPEMAEVIIRESDAVLGGVPGFVLASAGGIISPNAGIDRSNAAGCTSILYPADAYGAAERVRRKVFLEAGVHVGVVLADSRLMPARAGTVGVAVSCAGMSPVRDARAERDLYGNPLRVTMQATADSLATAANHVMGEGSESVPFAIVRGSGVPMTDRRILPSEPAVPHEQCVYVRGLGGGA